ncbi:hypothetical protein PGT21_018776 [Puccinia graminis f. sp. tritici]|uniref:Uncharacterized protein n=2 Tax=Puccinia graminis f. sp. tritici TaxID=56615 RepID=E3L1H3_PUCGT|nr:uncharacterized protein PGTG_16158 [Puccinia graminis f. sp. tritici CRL 75-36-700-3]KAA1074712.1 hypothetical protein PGT21_016737 [Puccinia graminis f. sp. tritici]EFP90398.2 hypothetical protein PGTG_16158 [Puccinia graminis f. sp. tritici CRL 75-36-700-3]KAA1080735.1 hypothetical protein PGT21_018776 [Puccinia graminis f. sp. tritici]KAA1092089.1 hypothetical protein PGTUg99_017271 [Puccinia graminis f. sp. tritici]KAA1115864.1 hypothetical protein PGTUg99_007796 [Puccinia graminis f. s
MKIAGISVVAAAILSSLNSSQAAGGELTQHIASEHEWITTPGLVQQQIQRGEWGEKNHLPNGLKVSNGSYPDKISITNQGQTLLEYLLIDLTGSRFLLRKIEPNHQDIVPERDADVWARHFDSSLSEADSRSIASFK